MFDYHETGADTGLYPLSSSLHLSYASSIVSIFNLYTGRMEPKQRPSPSTISKTMYSLKGGGIVR